MCFDTGLLKNKVAIITGAGSGIGQETALLFAKHQAKIALFDISKPNLEAVYQEIQLLGGQAVAIEVDITDSAMVQKACRKVVSEFGQIDILLNIAGIFISGRVEDTSSEDWRKILDINLTGMFLCMKHVIPELKKTGGSIVNISSEAGLVGIQNQVAYNVSKAAVISLTKSTAVDYAQDKIRVNCICPGRVMTPLVKHIIETSSDSQKTYEELSFDRPMMHMGDPKEIAFACLMMGCDKMKYATGAILSVDGGYTAR
jgi:NAD(P)-dependent dehydrogenase (short-subunit alcohol dehydrogenase family)